jgi:outer membrane protein assembly factor BamB
VNRQDAKNAKEKERKRLMSHRLWLQIALVSLGVLGVLAVPLRAEDQSATYRGNPQRTGNVDGLAGPATPKVLWVHKSNDHFVAAPVAAGGRVFVSGLGAFNVATFLCLDADPKAVKRVVWSKGTPTLKLPTVSTPAIVENRLVFGDGMHQTDGAILHCLRFENGLPLWQLPVPGTLVHLEGSPTVAAGQVYLGGGAAGVLRVDLSRVTLDGKEMDSAAVRKILDAKWAELQSKYEADRKKDPDFAIPPSEDNLPKPEPVRVWQQGKDQWHVDAPVAVVGDRVLVGSAFLDKEKLGDRALFCLDAKTGSVRWRAGLKVNPWGGPSVSGQTVVVGGSTIGYDVKALKGAKGEVAAFDLADGKEKWRKELPGGVTSCVTLVDGLAIATATDGKVRAFDLTTGERRWVYDAKTPLFAPVAVAGSLVYAGDLKGVVHAIKRKDGTAQWTLDLGADPAVKAPGMIYGGPLVHGGRLFVATCNLEGPHARQATAVVCIGDQ